MKKVYFVAVSSDVENFNEITSYETVEQAKEGLKDALKWMRQMVIDAGFEDEMMVTEDENRVTINYNKGANGWYDSYYYAEIVSGSMFEEGEKPMTKKCYDVEIVTTIKRTYQIVAYSEDEAKAIAESDQDNYDDEEIDTEITATHNVWHGVDD